MYVCVYIKERKRKRLSLWLKHLHCGKIFNLLSNSSSSVLTTVGSVWVDEFCKAEMKQKWVSGSVSIKHQSNLYTGYSPKHHIKHSYHRTFWRASTWQSVSFLCLSMWTECNVGETWYEVMPPINYLPRAILRILRWTPHLLSSCRTQFCIWLPSAPALCFQLPVTES